MNSLNRRGFVGQIGLTAAGIILITGFIEAWAAYAWIWHASRGGN